MHPKIRRDLTRLRQRDRVRTGRAGTIIEQLPHGAMSSTIQVPFPLHAAGRNVVVLRRPNVSDEIENHLSRGLIRVCGTKLRNELLRTNILQSRDSAGV
jgi:hypothetical protein